MKNDQDLNLIENHNQEEKANMTNRERRTADFKRRYPLRSSCAYKKFLPKKMYWGGQIAILIQMLSLIGMLIENSWHSFLIPMSVSGVLICFFTVGLKEEEGPLYDNWRGIVYKYLSVSLLAQLLTYTLLIPVIK